jgi:hypothetical protein
MEQQARFPVRKSQAGRLALQLLLIALSVDAAAALAANQTTQRMLIESQNFSIPAGGKAEPRAMCLDASSASPSPATRFAVAPKDLGDIRVTVPGGKEMSLQAAIDKHIVEVRGTQGYSSVQFRNLLPSGEIKVNVVKNSVVMPDGSYRAEDLKGLPELKAEHLVSQSALWESRSVQMAARGDATAAASPVVVTGQRAIPAQMAVQAQMPVQAAKAQPPVTEAPPPPPPQN